MNNIQPSDKDMSMLAQKFNRLPVSQRALAAGDKYACAVALYASTGMSLREIAGLCDVTPGGLSAHIGRYHRQLLYARYGLNSAAPDADICVKAPKGQSLNAHIKYKDAIEACGDLAYIEYNVSQIAHMFDLDGTALASQLRAHYPDVIPSRENLRARLGVADNMQRGPRKTSADAYREAIRMYHETDMTLGEVAQRCDVSKSGLCQFIRFYRKDVMADKARRRTVASHDAGMRGQGRLSGNGRMYGPKPETVAMYAPALELYRSTGMTLKEIVRRTGVPAGGFRGYLRQWHPEIESKRRHAGAASDKYAAAIGSLRANPRDVTDVAAEFGLNANSFRTYLKNHEPELAARQGMTRLVTGRTVKRSSADKYRAAIEEYATTTEPLKSIAQRHGLVYNSILGYVTRNCPEAREAHRKLVEDIPAAI